MRLLASTACLSAIALATALVCLPQSADAQIGYGNVRNGVVSQTAANRFGLKRSWFTQIELDRSQARVTHLTQHVSPTRFATKFAVITPEDKEYFTAEMVDIYGDVLGEEGAEKAAKDRVQELKDKNNIDAELKTILVPEITLYAQTDRGVLHALDGETGRTKWIAAVGNRNHPTLEPGANDKYVGVINGSNLFVLDQANGKLVWTRQIGSAPGAGPALTDDRIFVPTVNGKLEVFELEDYRRPPWYYQSTGRLLVQPTVATNSVSWATDRGFLYVSQRDRPGVRFRLETRDAITSPATYLPPNRLFAASSDGYAYCVHEFNGDILWRFSAGDPITAPAVATTDGVYIIADGSGLYRVNTDNGLEKWWSPKIEKLLAISNDRVYCMAQGGRFVILDANTGGRIDSTVMQRLDLLHTNWETDRIFVGTKTGVVQCLHELDADWPTVHNIPDPEDSSKPQVIQRKEGDEPAADDVKPVDPFGGPADPFGAAPDPFGAKPADGGAAAPADPFGGPDPFGAGAPAAGGDPPPADPFGADPF